MYYIKHGAHQNQDIALRLGQSARRCLVTLPRNNSSSIFSPCVNGDFKPPKYGADF